MIRNRVNFDPGHQSNLDEDRVLVIKADTKVKGKYSKKLQRVASKYRPGQVLPTKTIMQRMFNGSIVDKLIPGQYYGGDHDSIDVEEIERADYIEKIDLYDQNAEFMNQQMELIKKHNAEMEALRKEQEKKKLREEIEAEKKQETPPAE